MALNFVTTGFNECIGVRKPVARAMSNALTAIMDTPRSIAVQDLRSQLHVCDNRIASLEQQLYERDMVRPISPMRVRAL